MTPDDLKPQEWIALISAMHTEYDLMHDHLAACKHWEQYWLEHGNAKRARTLLSISVDWQRRISNLESAAKKLGFPEMRDQSAAIPYAERNVVHAEPELEDARREIAELRIEIQRLRGREPPS